MFFNIDKIAILTNGNSASGSEIMAAAIQDWDRGLVIGQATYGKGLVQQVFPLNNGGALRLTIAKYYTPSGRLIQKSYNNINKDFIADTTIYKTKLLSRLVDGGGGVVPDYFVDDDYATYCRDYDVYIDLYLLHLMKLNGTSRLQSESFSAEALNQFILSEYGDDMLDIGEVCHDGLLPRMEARLLRMHEGDLKYKQQLNTEDPYILKALDLISNDKTTLALLSENDN